MKGPVLHRGKIPFFHKKTETEFQQDAYERYDPMVIRQSALHLADDLWGAYPFQPMLDFAQPHRLIPTQGEVVELGCGVGRWVGELAQQHPEATFWGLDFSYQMLKRAREFWVDGVDLHLDLSPKGFQNPSLVRGFKLNNLSFGLAKASELPFSPNSQDLVFHSFLLDRLPDPKKALSEWHRVLKPGGMLIFVSPLNFAQASQWRDYYPPVKLSLMLQGLGYKLLEWQEDLLVEEPLDIRGNAVAWRCLGVVAEKSV